MRYRFGSPVVILMYGLPGAGKSAFARQFSAEAGLAHVHSDRLRFELYDDASFSPSENQTVLRLASYMCEEILKTGQSLVFDMHLPTQRLRDELRQLAAKTGAKTRVVWVQTDRETAQYRSSHRDRRRPDDKYAFNLSQAQFEQLAAGAGGNFRPNEGPIVISGKHLYGIQAKAVWRRLAENGLVTIDSSGPTTAGRVDYERRFRARSSRV
jgi:predicted kinase